MFLKQGLLCATLIFALFPSITLRVWAQEASVVKTSRITYDPGSNRAPRYGAGLLVAVEKNDSVAPIIHSFQRDGQEAVPVVFSMLNAQHILIGGVVPAADRRLALCGAAYDANGGGSGFVAWIAPGSRATKIVRTFPYTPYLIAVAPDGSTWTEGIEMVNGKESDSLVNPAHGVLRRFDSSGQEDGSFLPRSNLQYMQPGLTSGRISAGKDRVGWYVPKVNEFISIQANGQADHIPGPPLLLKRRRRRFGLDV